jgi:hypothetical protein
MYPIHEYYPKYLKIFQGKLHAETNQRNLFSFWQKNPAFRKKNQKVPALPFTSIP